MPTSTDSPRDAEGWYRLGNTHGQSGDHERAARCFAEALKLRPQTPEIVRNLGATLQILGRTDEAIECYRRFLQKTPGTAVYIVRKPKDRVEIYESPRWRELAGEEGSPESSR